MIYIVDRIVSFTTFAHCVMRGVDDDMSNYTAALAIITHLMAAFLVISVARANS